MTMDEIAEKISNDLVQENITLRRQLVELQAELADLRRQIDKLQSERNAVLLRAERGIGKSSG